MCHGTFKSIYFSSWIPFRTTNLTIVECGVQHWPVAGSTGQDFTVDSSRWRYGGCKYAARENFWHTRVRSAAGRKAQWERWTVTPSIPCLWLHIRIRPLTLVTGRTNPSSTDELRDMLTITVSPGQIDKNFLISTLSLTCKEGRCECYSKNIGQNFFTYFLSMQFTIRGVLAVVA